jgi:hypothetical protein
VQDKCSLLLPLSYVCETLLRSRRIPPAAKAVRVAQSATRIGSGKPNFTFGTIWGSGEAYGFVDWNLWCSR